MTTDEASDPTQEPSDNDQADAAVDAQSQPEAGADTEPAAEPEAEADAEAEAEAKSEAAERSEPNQERLDGLQEDIDRVRARAEDEVGGGDTGIPEADTDRQFVERGTEGRVDDTIAPPG